MKKDYIPKETNSKIEIEVVENYWTKIWQNKNITYNCEIIKKREETALMMPYLKELKKGSRILDGGCGLGQWTHMLDEMGFETYGLDISKETINRLNKEFPSSNFSVADIRGTEFKDSFFDAYFSWGTFEHFENGMGECFKEARRIIKKNGLLFLTIPFQNKRHLKRDLKDLWNWDENYNKENGYNSEMVFYQWRLTKPELHRELILNGFVPMEITPIHKNQGIIRLLASKGIRENHKIFGFYMKFYQKICSVNEVGHMLFVAARKN